MESETDKAHPSTTRRLQPLHRKGATPSSQVGDAADSRGSELRSILVDGVLAAGILLLVVVVTLLLNRVFRNMGAPYVLIYALTLIALAFCCLEFGLHHSLANTTRAWYGMVGGIFAWSAVRTAQLIGMGSLTSANSILLLIMASLFFGVMWLHGLPLGVQFWLQAFLLNWLGNLLIEGQKYLSQWSNFFNNTLTLTGYTAILAVLLIGVWLFERSTNRLKRLRSALFASFCLTIVLMVFMGGLS
ncbi:MAG: hypothetical protein ABFD44_12230 [Anaerolineaceae bacterium]